MGKAVAKYLWLLKYVADSFVTHQQIKIWHDNDGYCNDAELIEWYKGHQKLKTQKAKIKEDLMPIVWNPSRWWDWCFPEDEKKKRQKNYGHKQGLFVFDDQTQHFLDDPEGYK